MAIRQPAAEEARQSPTCLRAIATVIICIVAWVIVEHRAKQDGSVPPQYRAAVNQATREPRYALTNVSVTWPLVARRPPRERRIRTTEGLRPSPWWTPTTCEPHSSFDSASQASQTAFLFRFHRDSRLGRMHASARCFFFASGSWNRLIDLGKLKADVNDGYRHRWAKLTDCTSSDMRTLHRTRWRMTRNSPGGETAVHLMHAGCRLPTLSDPYALIMALLALQGNPAQERATIEIVGDSLQRGLFMTLVHAIRGVPMTDPIFDRQSHANLRYLVMEASDELTMFCCEEPPRDTILDIRYHASFHDTPGGYPASLQIDARDAAPALVVAGGCDNTESSCPERFERHAILSRFAQTMRSPFTTVGDSGLERPARFKLKHLVIFDAPLPRAVLLSSRPTHMDVAVVPGYHALKNHVYMSVEQIASDHVFFIDETSLVNEALEDGSRTAMPALGTTDGLHIICTLQGALPNSIAGVKANLTEQCRGHRARAQLQVLFGVIGAALRSQP
jgi:hypothetical protein